MPTLQGIWGVCGGNGNSNLSKPNLVLVWPHPSLVEVGSSVSYRVYLCFMSPGVRAWGVLVGSDWSEYTETTCSVFVTNHFLSLSNRMWKRGDSSLRLCRYSKMWMLFTWNIGTDCQSLVLLGTCVLSLRVCTVFALFVNLLSKWFPQLFCSGLFCGSFLSLHSQMSSLFVLYSNLAAEVFQLPELIREKPAERAWGWCCRGGLSPSQQSCVAQACTELAWAK